MLKNSKHSIADDERQSAWVVVRGRRIWTAWQGRASPVLVCVNGAQMDIQVTEEIVRAAMNCNARANDGEFLEKYGGSIPQECKDAVSFIRENYD